MLCLYVLLRYTVAYSNKKNYKWYMTYKANFTKFVIRYIRLNYILQNLLFEKPTKFQTLNRNFSNLTF